MHAIPALLFAFCFALSLPHDGPDPLWHWTMTRALLSGQTLQARFGPPAVLLGKPELVQDQRGETMYFDGTSALQVLDPAGAVQQARPKQNVTLATWVSIETPQRWGGVFSLFQDNGDAEAGLVLGYDEEHFVFGLASHGADDGNGKMTYLRGTARYELGRLYHVVATYDGAEMRLYVNGALDAATKEQSGAILWPQEASITIGSYRDRDEDHRLHGSLRDLAVYDLAALPKWVAQEFEHGKELTTLPAVRHFPDDLTFVVAPYQQFVTQNGISILWETSRPSSSVVHFGPDAANLRAIAGPADAVLHRVRIEDLAPSTPYFFRVESQDDKGQQVQSPLLTLRTACAEDQAYAFVVIGDTQDQPKIASRIAQHAWSMRPDFAVTNSTGAHGIVRNVSRRYCSHSFFLTSAA
jgi:hypothetical protein